MFNVFIQEFDRNVPQHKEFLEGTKEFPVMMLGFTDVYNNLDPLRVSIYNFIEIGNEAISLFKEFLSSKIITIQVVEEGFNNKTGDFIFRKCKLMREVFIEKLYPEMNCLTLYPFTFRNRNKPWAVVFDMFFDVIN